jgi:hypothetical protein
MPLFFVSAVQAIIATLFHTRLFMPWEIIVLRRQPAVSHQTVRRQPGLHPSGCLFGFRVSRGFSGR